MVASFIGYCNINGFHITLYDSSFFSALYVISYNCPIYMGFIDSILLSNHVVCWPKNSLQRLPITVTGKNCSLIWTKSIKLRAIAVQREKRNLYQVLGVSEEASARDIKSAYRKLAKEFHPDTVLDECFKNVSNQRFADIKEAYSTLVDPENRAQYDFQLGLRIQIPTSARRYSCKKQGRSWETDQCW